MMHVYLYLCQSSFVGCVDAFMWYNYLPLARPGSLPSPWSVAREKTVLVGQDQSNSALWGKLCSTQNTTSKVIPTRYHCSLYELQHFTADGSKNAKKKKKKRLVMVVMCLSSNWGVRSILPKGTVRSISQEWEWMPGRQKPQLLTGSQYQSP